MSALNVFVSFCEEDKALVDSLQAQTALWSGISIFRYDRHPQPGVPVVDKIKAAIAKADVALVLLTRNSNRSSWIAQEVGAARMLGKPIVPLCEPGAHVPEMLEGIERIKLDPKNPLGGVGRAAGALTMHLADKALKEQNFLLLVGFLIALIVLRDG